MSQYNQNQPRAKTPVPAAPMTAPNYGAPPSDADAIKHGPPYPNYVPPRRNHDEKTFSKGDGFWRGW
ncbi:hypothetical protein L484_005323 [Morus notabilis]|uniref:Uncharacterized protein n=1 Tax=Morus notabilis TaxID=981085 RepID=W9RH34_9ROSA|nr:hypothetical protein L484_005323 [Morus notabilis]